MPKDLYLYLLHLYPGFYSYTEVATWRSRGRPRKTLNDVFSEDAEHWLNQNGLTVSCELLHAKLYNTKLWRSWCRLTIWDGDLVTCMNVINMLIKVQLVISNSSSVLSARSYLVGELFKDETRGITRIVGKGQFLRWWEVLWEQGVWLGLAWTRPWIFVYCPCLGDGFENWRHGIEVPSSGCLVVSVDLMGLRGWEHGMKKDFFRSHLNAPV